jgi:nucleotide-binding universal stress UspA family protein
MLNFRNVLYPMDLDAEAVSSVVTALEFARLFQSKLHILYVNDIEAGYRHPADHEDAVALRVRKEVPEHFLEGVEMVYATAKGDPAEEILKYAREHKIDLIIVGHKHRGKLYSLMFDLVDVQVIDRAFLPVLVIPEKENAGGK